MRMRKRHLACLPVLAGLGAGAPALGQGTISDGDAVYENNDFSPAGVADWWTDGTGSSDHLYRNAWFYRVVGDPSQTLVHYDAGGIGEGPDFESYTGNTATIGWVQSAIDLELNIKVFDGPGLGQSQLLQVMEITNTGQSAVDVALFNFVDLDVGGTAGGDSGIIDGTGTLMTIEDDGGDVVEWLGVGADAWEIRSFNGLFVDLDGTEPYDLDNSGSPFGSGDFTGAFQWNLTIAPDSSVRITAGGGVNTPAIPAPGALALLGLAVPFARRSRRRNTAGNRTHSITNKVEKAMKREKILGGVAAALVASFVSAPVAFGQGIITDGDAQYWNTAGPVGTAFWWPDGPTATNHLNRNTWFYRIAGDTGQTLVHYDLGTGGAAPDAESYLGRKANIFWDQSSLDLELTIKLFDGVNDGESQLLQVMKVTNTSQSAVDVSIFNFVDLDVGGTINDDTAVVDVNGSLFTVDDPGGDTVEWFGPDADAWEIRAFPDLFNDLNSGADYDLTSTGSPLSDSDFTGAFQWNLTIQPGEFLKVKVGAGINMPATPGPGSLAALTVAGILVRPRRRR